MSSYCNICRRWFSDDRALSQHKLNSSKHPNCSVCGNSFASQAKLRKHCKQKHYFCDDCDEPFDDLDDYLDHGEEEHYACRACIKIFKTSGALASHNEASHYYCRSCDRHFSSERGLSTHNASSIHTPRWLACPARKCGKAFCSVSALLHHAESSACPSGVTRRTINKYVAKVDKQNIITNPARMIAAPGGAYHPPPEPNYLATEKSWNGVAYKCFLCGSGFQSLDSLNQHLKSPRHLQRIYHCPMRGCGTEFTVLSALCQHVESGACGLFQAKMLQSAVQYLACGMRALAT